MRYPFALLLALASLLAPAQEYATARIMESHMKKASFIHLAYDNGEHESIDLADWSTFGGPGGLATTMMQNQQTYTKLIGTMHGKGYALIQSSESSTDSYLITLLVFRREVR
jgi:hypothetical protein